MIPSSYLSVLRQLAPRLATLDIDWAITGSVGMALQGMPLDVHDIDLQTDEAGAYAIEREFAHCVYRPVSMVDRESFRSFLGALVLDGIKVEIIGDMQKRLPDGTWEPPVRVGDITLWIATAGMRLPVLSLEHEVQAYQLMGRLEKAALIRDWLRNRSRCGQEAE